LSRKRKVEGWALEVSNLEDTMGRSFLQRVGDNNKLWLGAVVALLLVSFFLLFQSKPHTSANDDDLYSPPAVRPNCNYNDAEHTAFAKRFIVRKDIAGKVIDARFAAAVNPKDGDRFVIVVAADTSLDDVENIAQLAAEKNRADFKTRIIVVTYRIDPATRSEVKVATTKWIKSRYGFVTTFVRSDE